jgi:XTP/dITP diphosphohydrolase
VTGSAPPGSAELVLATFNAGKVRELSALLAAPGRRLRSLAEFAGARVPEETGMTLIENARLKAEAAVRLTGLPAIADDTALEVDALEGAPGVHSARYAGEGARDADNVALLLERLAAVPPGRRSARFRTLCVARFPDGRERIGEGVLEGAIATAPRGTNGFGYDPVFELPEGKTLAELDEASKNALSHRARAARALAEQLT